MGYPTILFDSQKRYFREINVKETRWSFLSFSVNHFIILKDVHTSSTNSRQRNLLREKRRNALYSLKKKTSFQFSVAYTSALIASIMDEMGQCMTIYFSRTKGTKMTLQSVIVGFPYS